MFYFILRLIVLYLTLLIRSSVTVSSVPHQRLIFNLSTPDEDNQKQNVFTTKFNLTKGQVIIDIINATSDNGFFVIQAHSFQYNISLSNTQEFKTDSVVVGTNIGLVESPLMTKTLYRYYLSNAETPNVDVFLAVIVYEESDPIPGGCNMVFNTHYAPYQIITYDENMITVDASPAKASSCDILTLPRLDMYHLYLEEETFDKNTYFNGIANFLTVKHIKKYGTKVSDSVKHLPLRRYYNAYKSTGTIFAIIANSHNYSSAYVPAVSYACDINNWEENCVGPVSMTWKLLFAVILFMGIFMCYFGHRFFRMAMFLFGFLFGSFIFYIAINIVNNVTVEQSVGYALIFGSVYGICWLLLWWRYGIPILSVSLPVIFIGYITGCLVFHTGVADLGLFRSDVNYWSVLFCIIVPITISLLLVTEFANILACGVVGATAVIIIVDYYIGASIRYIILNNIRRAMVPKFYLAILDPPFQYKDIILCVVWTGLVLFGVLVQRKLQLGKPPFPPHRSLIRIPWERTPLLSQGVNSNSVGAFNENPTYT
ncbi:hypothetical protein RN001_003054 [Aquatica leii]|uniref:TM7S3/TM198-like domain-containing protein n=1 Tax=Aquatica leii TaxID=1421715 RepID=A0AAN7SRG5_9COLE|nr:hypothetical protein RN001_003054 [Aquatica leii]